MNKVIKNEIKLVKNTSELEILKEDINKEIDRRKEVLEIGEKAISLSKKNFGFIKESMEKLIPELIKTKEGKKMIRRYINEIKSSKELTSKFNFYENINEIKKDTDAILLIKEWKEANKKNISSEKKDLSKLGDILAESYIWAGKNADKLLPSPEREKLFVLTERVYKTNPSTKNMAGYFNDISVIKDMALTHNLNEEKNMEEIYKELNKNLSLNSSEISEDKSASLQEKFNTSKENCLKRLNEIKDNFKKDEDFDSFEKINLYIESIEGKNFNSDTANNDICNFKELTECFN